MVYLDGIDTWLPQVLFAIIVPFVIVSLGLGRRASVTATEECAHCDDHWTVTTGSAAETARALDHLRARHEARWHAGDRMVAVEPRNPADVAAEVAQAISDRTARE